MLGVSVALPQGHLIDTPEVQAERQRFFQLFNEAAALAAAAPDDNQITQQAFHHSAPNHFHGAPHTPKWRGPLAATVPAGVDGTITPVADTAEVAQAKRAFETAFQQQLRATVPHPSGNSIHFQSAQPASFHQTQPKWRGPLATNIPAGLPGSVSQVPNTPEVEAAIAEFTRTFNSAARSASPVARHTPFQSFTPVHSTSHQQPRWQGPFAATVPAGLPGSGAVSDTADVAQARASFDRAFQQQLSAVLG